MTTHTPDLIWGVLFYSEVAIFGAALSGAYSGANDLDSRIREWSRQLEAVQQDQNHAALQALYNKYVPLGFGQNKTASGTQAGTYRATRPQNVEFPTVPIINLSMDRVAQLNGGILPQTGEAFASPVCFLIPFTPDTAQWTNTDLPNRAAAPQWSYPCFPPVWPAQRQPTGRHRKKFQPKRPRHSPSVGRFP